MIDKFAPSGLAIAPLGIVSALLMTAMTVQAENRRPTNVIIILADDLGYGDLGSYGSKEIKTPHIDALAGRGVKFNQAYSTSPVDAPARAGLLTGRYPQRIGLDFNLKPTDPPELGLPVEAVTIAERLKEVGYATGAVGKWQLGRDPSLHPLKQGFDSFFGFLGSVANPFPAAKPSPAARAARDIRRGYDHVDEAEFLSDALTRESLEFISAKKDVPFFLYASFPTGYVPFDAPTKYLERAKSVGSDIRRHRYAAQIIALDDAVGAIVGRLKALGIEDDTLIIFTNDNGPNGRYLSPATNGPLRGAKPELLEGGVRVPLIIAWTNHLPNVAYERPVSLLDLAPTILSAAGAPTKEPSLDGVSLIPFLSNPGAVNGPHEYLFFRYGDDYAVRDARYKILRDFDGPPRLFDLQADPTESRNLINDHPEIANRLLRSYEAWNASLPKPTRKNPRNIFL